MRQLSFVAVVFFVLTSSAHATVYFSLNAESGTVGTAVPVPPMCGWPCGADNYTSCGTRPRYESAGGAPQGSKFIQFDIAHPGLAGQPGAQMCPSVPDGTPDHYQTFNAQLRNSGQHDHGQELRTGTYTITGIMDKTLYVAYWFKFETFADSNFPAYRQNVFQNGASTGAMSNVQSGEKGVEIVGEAFRWEVGCGQWDSYYGNSANHFTCWLGNPSHHLNPSLEFDDIYRPNQNGYSYTAPYQMAYNQWHSVVMQVTTKRDNTGAVALWINGTKIIENTGIATVNTGGNENAIISLGGTLCQPDYDCPKHTRKYDAFLLTDSWSDIVAGGYLQGSDTTPPAAPTGLAVE